MYYAASSGMAAIEELGIDRRLGRADDQQGLHAGQSHDSAENALLAKNLYTGESDGSVQAF